MLSGLSREAAKSKPVLSLLKPLGAPRRWGPGARLPALPACPALLPGLTPSAARPTTALQSTTCRTTRAARTSWVGG